MLLVLALVVSVLGIVVYQQYKTNNETKIFYRSKLLDQREKFANILSAKIDDFDFEKNILLRNADQQKALNADLIELVRIISNESNDYSRNEWMKSLNNKTYSSESEVDCKFVYKMIMFLGYSDEEILSNHTMKVQFGSEKKNLELIG